MEPEGEFFLEPIHILDKREVQLRKPTVAYLKAQWKHYEVNEATWDKEATMRKAYLALFHDVILSP